MNLELEMLLKQFINYWKNEMPKAPVGKIFGLCEITGNDFSKKRPLVYWIYKCNECGKEGSCSYLRLTSGEKTRCSECFNKTKKFRTGSRKDYLHFAWVGIKARCNNPNSKFYHNYGGRGISICKEWSESFREFSKYIVDTIGERPTNNHTIERINNNGNYEPRNIKWATRMEQSSNLRTNVLITYNGETFNTSQWARKLGLSRCGFYWRLQNMTLDDAMTKPIKGR